MAVNLFYIVLLAVSANAQGQLWTQCGGIGFSGSTSCVSGAYCYKQNDYYSQCIPGSVSSVASTITTVTPAPTSVTSATTLVTTVSTTSNAGTTTAAAPTGAATCAAVPSSITLKSNAKLPDPFLNLSGTRVSTAAEFTCRQGEISELLQRYELGALPGPPETLTASFSGSTLTINAGNAGKSISFTVSITYPSSGTAPYPAIIAYGGGSLPAPAGVAMINFNNDDIAAQASTGSRGQGKFYNLYGSSHSAGALTAWAWGVGRVIDALEKTPTARVDTTRLGVTGCSRNGKGAFVAGALNPRIALTLPQESGAGGSACWRISDSLKSQGQNIQTASEIVTENVWFSSAFNNYVNQVPTLPFDHHMLAALVAPRALFVIENNIDWLGPASAWGCMKTAHKVWEALGVPDNMGYSQIGSHNHCQFPSNQQAALTAFVQKFLLKQSSNTAVMQADSSFTESQWVDWTVPTLA
ncbi:cip2 [Phlyctema vagabunda]|uniref:(4-O-methyl)-D-glucuronate--lignin esterase n=1 Tax=Phlyctema vagabunda TaxID=108571 RepID=A0ABR4P6D8_9HELO